MRWNGNSSNLKYRHFGRIEMNNASIYRSSFSKYSMWIIHVPTYKRVTITTRKRETGHWISSTLQSEETRHPSCQYCLRPNFSTFGLRKFLVFPPLLSQHHTVDFIDIFWRSHHQRTYWMMTIVIGIWYRLNSFTELWTVLGVEKDVPLTSWNSGLDLLIHLSNWSVKITARNWYFS